MIFTPEKIKKFREYAKTTNPEYELAIVLVLDELECLQTRVQELEEDRVEIKEIVDGIYNDVHFMPCVKKSIEMKVISLAGILDQDEPEER